MIPKLGIEEGPSISIKFMVEAWILDLNYKIMWCSSKSFRLTHVYMALKPSESLTVGDVASCRFI